MERVENINSLKVGDKVTYRGIGGITLEKGIVKSILTSDIPNNHVRVVYNCNEDWENYKDYTSQKTHIDTLLKGWEEDQEPEPNIFETVSFHLVKPCNKKCKFCYATFNDFHTKMLSYSEAEDIIIELALAGVKKITFAGGEPMLYPHLKGVIKRAKLCGMTTSIITNGSLLTEDWLIEMKPYLDWIGLSIDSLSIANNIRSGRFISLADAIDYEELVSLINKHDFKLKINTVIHAFNWFETLLPFIKQAKPSRWKVFDVLKVEGQNEDQYQYIKADESQRDHFLENNKHESMVYESNDLMTGSYLLIDPRGRFFENTAGTHTYSDPILEVGVERALTQINLKRDKFLERGGIYQW